MDDVKVKIPKFLGTYDSEAYLDQEMKVDQIFNCNNFSEEKKMQLASSEFEGYALVWWNQIQVDRERLTRYKVDVRMDGNEENHEGEIWPTSLCKGNAY